MNFNLVFLNQFLGSLSKGSCWFVGCAVYLSGFVFDGEDDVSSRDHPGFSSHDSLDDHGIKGFYLADEADLSQMGIGSMVCAKDNPPFDWFSRTNYLVSLFHNLGVFTSDAI